MSTYNKKGKAQVSGTSPVKSRATPTATTFEGHPGYARDPKSELFLLASTQFMSQDTFYEKSGQRANRLVELVHRVVLDDPGWVLQLADWLRVKAHLRSVALVVGLEAARALNQANRPSVPAYDVPGWDSDRGLVRMLAGAGIIRADEPGEALAYWTSRYGRNIPIPVKKGIADRVRQLYTQRNLLKYDTDSHAFRFGDVVELTHPRPGSPEQSDLFRYAIDRRHNRANGIPENLDMVRANALLREDVAGLLGGGPDNPAEALLDPQVLRKAGMTWEDALSLAGDKVPKKQLWEALIPTMGYMACLAEGTEIWVPDGTTVPIEQVVARRLPVLTPSRPFDTSVVRYGPSQPSRDRTMGKIVPALPSSWLSMGERPVVRIEFVSGRSVSATLDHRWVKRCRNDRRESWEWVTTADLRVGDGIPAPIGVDAWGDEGDSADGYFVGAMLGDGCMTNFGTPEFAQVDEPSRADMLQFFSDYAGKLGCVFAKCGERKWRITYPPVQKMNPATDVLRHYEVWGLKSGEKRLPARPLSREFWIGALSGLIDTDGHVRIRTNPKGTVHASIEYATISETMAYQAADALQRLGIQSNVSARQTRPGRFSKPGVAARDVHIVTVNRAASIRRANEVLALRHTVKAARLAEAAALMPITPVENVELDRIVAISEPFAAQVYCVTVDESSSFVANGVVTGNCLRNLRNFDQAGLSEEVTDEVALKLMDPDQVARSRQLPLRFLSAYEQVPNLRWGPALEKALQLSLGNIPFLTGRTLILVDTSGSMTRPFSVRGTRSRMDAAVLFGVALAQRVQDADIVSFSGTQKLFRLQPGESLLKALDRWKRDGYNIGRGTYTSQALNAYFERGHSRVVIVTDEQAHLSGYAYSLGSVRRIPQVTESVPDTVPMHVINIAGYEHGMMPSGEANRFTYGGLGDFVFQLIPLVEAGANGHWPWVQS